jgi:predicted nucleic acid-binding protein
MAWVVDTSVLLDIHTGDPAFSHLSAACLARCSGDGLLVCPVTYVEMAPAFAGNMDLEDLFLQQLGVEWPTPWTILDTRAAHTLWNDHVTRKRAGHAGKRPIADVLIEAFAQRFQGLITRNPNHFTTVPILVP